MVRKLVKTRHDGVYVQPSFGTGFRALGGSVSLLATYQNVQHDTQAFVLEQSVGSGVHRTLLGHLVSALLLQHVVHVVDKLSEVLWCIVEQVSESVFFHDCSQEWN